MKLSNVLCLGAGLALPNSAAAFTFTDKIFDISNQVDNYGVPKNLKQLIKSENNAMFSATVYEEDPSYSLRMLSVDPGKLGLDTVKQWSGYLDYKDSKHFFYWFFESRNDPENDPVILWLNGGPGCSSFTGLFFELGPSSLGPDLKPIYNPYSWNNNASVVFLEQPLGVGFSYGDEKVASTKAAGRDVYVFLELFFQKFPHLRKNDFHIAGESYAGHYIPQIAHEIVVENPDRSFNLTSIMIGNGATDPLIQSDYYQPMACGEGGYPSVLTEEECDKMARAMPRCRMLNTACYLTESSIPCFLSSAYCNLELMEPYVKTGLNVYDIRGPCEMADDHETCYYGMSYIDQYMNQEYVQEAVGSDVHHYAGCNMNITARFAMTGDNGKPFQQFVAEMVDRDIPVLIYAGDKDYICNWLGNKAWTDALEWKYHDLYENAPMQSWLHSTTAEELGAVKNYGPLTFLRIYDAGHLVPHDQPEAALDMVNRWIAGDYAFN